MSPSITLAATGGALFACGLLLMMERSLTRLVIGILLAGNGANVLILSTGGHAGKAPIRGGHTRAPFSDPLPQAMILTSIVISLASAAFVFAIAYRSGRLTGDDEVRDDIEDRRVTRGDQELRTQIREQRREFRAWSRAQRRHIRRARADLRAGIREERRRRAVDDPARIDDYPEDPAARGGGGAR
ncbi:Na(+)/H(+) antiporter subunit C [Actinomadura atramentaria]|uniref:Na(+)/H(+) antiporter subunit C n=1 Tax=Actinomadura atramentaria TaxID=1990 RepID=UPI00036A108A|nr:Na(+)/H(+) antiporter subunit C [Actinomadura atramentaria]